jgi:hypothetical protein
MRRVNMDRVHNLRLRLDVPGIECVLLSMSTWITSNFNFHHGEIYFLHSIYSRDDDHHISWRRIDDLPGTPKRTRLIGQHSAKSFHLPEWCSSQVKERLGMQTA